MDIFNRLHAAEAARVGQHPLQRSVRGWNATCTEIARKGLHTHTHTGLVFGVADFQLIDSIVIISVRISCKAAARQATFGFNQSQKTSLVN